MPRKQNEFKNCFAGHPLIFYFLTCAVKLQSVFLKNEIYGDHCAGRIQLGGNISYIVISLCRLCGDLAAVVRENDMAGLLIFGDVFDRDVGVFLLFGGNCGC